MERTLAEVAGSMLTADLALTAGMAVSTAGGTHHAHRAHGSGFCIFNDLAVTARRALDAGTVERVLIVDFDVHQAGEVVGRHLHAMAAATRVRTEPPQVQYRSLEPPQEQPNNSCLD